MSIRKGHTLAKTERLDVSQNVDRVPFTGEGCVQVYGTKSSFTVYVLFPSRRLLQGTLGNPELIYRRQ